MDGMATSAANNLYHVNAWVARPVAFPLEPSPSTQALYAPNAHFGEPLVERRCGFSGGYHMDQHFERHVFYGSQLEQWSTQHWAPVGDLPGQRHDSACD